MMIDPSRRRIRFLSLRKMAFGCFVVAVLASAGEFASFASADDPVKKQGVPLAERAPSERAAEVARARKVVEHLASDEFAGRAGADSMRAADWVAGEFEALGLKPLFGDSYFQIIPNGDDVTIGKNVAGIVRGTDPDLRDEFVFVTGHHDHLGTRAGEIYHGANDNASAVAMVLEAARRFAKKPAARTTVFVSFDLEENMLWGSRYFVANCPIDLGKISLFITADMIGRPLGDLPLDEVFVIGAESGQALSSTIVRKSSEVGQNILQLGADIVGTRSDYGPFRDKRVPFAFFSTGENPDYHTPRDIPEKLDFERMVTIVELVIGTAREVAEADESLVWSDERPAGIGEAKTLKRVCDVVTAEVEAGRMTLGVVEKLLVTQTAAKANGIVSRGSMTPSERTWLVRAAQGMLLTLF